MSMKLTFVHLPAGQRRNFDPRFSGKLVVYSLLIATFFSNILQITIGFW